MILSLFQLLENWCLNEVSVQISRKPLSGFKKWVILKEWLFLLENLFFSTCLSAFCSPIFILNANES